MSKKKIACLINFVCVIAFCLAIVFCVFLASNFSIAKSNINITYSLNICSNNASVALDASKELSDEINKKLDELNTGQFDDVLSNLTDRQKSIFGNVSFVEKIKQILNGSEKLNFSTLLQLLLSIIGDNIIGIVPILATVCAIAIISNILMKIRGKAMNKPLGDIIHFACFAVIVVVVLTGVSELIKLTAGTLESLKNQMEVLFPILLTVMASLGAGSSVSIYQPLIAILSGIMMEIFSKIVLPVFALSIIFNVIGNLTGTVKLNKMSNFFSSLFKTITGFCFTIFLGSLAISGIVAGSFDSISIRATKFAIKSYIPTIGGFLSDGFSLILASSVLIKNAGGYAGIILLFATVITPLTKIFLFKLGLSLVAGIIEPVADERVTNFVSKTAKSLSMLYSIILAFSFAYIICVGLIMCTSNLV